MTTVEVTHVTNTITVERNASVITVERSGRRARTADTQSNTKTRTVG